MKKINYTPTKMQRGQKEVAKNMRGIKNALGCTWTRLCVPARKYIFYRLHTPHLITADKALIARRKQTTIKHAAVILFSLHVIM